MGVTLAIALGAGAWLNAVEGAAELSHDYEARVAPTLEALRTDPAVAVVATSPFTALGGGARRDAAPPDAVRPGILRAPR